MMPLYMVSEGGDCKVCKISDGSGNASRLREMGFIDKATIKVFRSDQVGVIIDINGSRLALGRGVAKDIMVTI
jgi:Fe2+ transport system protein FeoA